jgi:hypothetical protein
VSSSQSTKPFQAETDALRAVSTVPPITTSFYANNESENIVYVEAVIPTRVSWIAPVFIPKGESMFFRVSIVDDGGGEG